MNRRPSISEVAKSGVRLTLDGDATIDVVIPDGQMFHSNFEFGALTQEIDECGIPFGKVDAKPVGPRALLAIL